MKRLIFLLSLFVIAGCSSGRDVKKFEERITKLEIEVNRLRNELSEANGEVSSAVGKVKALEKNYEI
ncbi:MAG: hypothetical protein ABIL23_03900, partial [candidate division WOR-3 bacterium]